MAKEEARRDSGLGASQTAEVAYLEKMGLEYEEHDITEFTFRKLADLSGFGLAAKRIAFPGKIILSALDCIVSFPGKYSKAGSRCQRQEWDAAVSSTQQGNGCSLACVFLTDRASGLADNPDTPGRCWCHTIYGELPLDTYLMVIDVHDETNGPITEEVLAFKRADAAAMGLVLVIKEDQTELEWESELNQALKIAEERCRQNGCRAPWGCSWFEEWRKNVEEAMRLGQKLHVFYFEGKVGRGKLAWPKLCDSMAKEEARRDSGLGASQTAEVAYLEKMGLEYEEHDITEFEAFLRKCHTWASPRAGVHPAPNRGATCAASMH
ncbi:Uncharacterized protein SCF082_LOCUS18393 [Durusdinium trenchii]|uniref:Uncharacterized protein n=1 Tax=Durusdinium trenchii TaxID=1381693 RepID=A0ABP0KP89_9DINO